MAPLEPIAASPNATQPILSIEDLEAKVARLKRTITDLEAATPTPNKRLTSTVTLGRGYRRVSSMFQDIATLVQEADRREEEDSEDEGDTSISLETKRDCDRTFKAFEELVQIVPSFKPNLLNSDSAALASYFAMLTRGANEAHRAHSDDICGLKKCIAEWLNKSASTMPHLDVDDRSMRGLQHDTTGRLICPIEYDWDNAEVRTKLRNGEDGYDAFDSFYVRCLYKGGKGDPNDVKKGFLRNYLLVKTYLYIFTSPSSAKNIIDDLENTGENGENTPAKTKGSSSKATKSSVAQKLNLHAVTPRSIAYAAILLHFSLSDAPHWKSTYNGFSYELFYNFIVDFFEDTDGPQAKQHIESLLTWWNKQIFPKRATATAASRASINKLREQRARRET